MIRFVYRFGGGQAEGCGNLKDLLGGKGANLAEMARIGLPVPPGFTITTEVCKYYHSNGMAFPPGLSLQVADALKQVEEVMGAKFGDTRSPLLVSCRSGAHISMAGLMDTILNIGINDEAVESLVALTGNERFAVRSYCRLLLMLGEIVMGLNRNQDRPLEQILEQAKFRQGVRCDTELNVESLRTIITEYKAAIKQRTGKEFPTDPHEQMWKAIRTVFDSWMSDRARAFRRQYDIPDESGTACNIMAMVFGNLGDDSATGVALTRDPATGTKRLSGEYLLNAQGEDVIAGIRSTKQIDELQQDLPNAYAQLESIRTALDGHYRETQEIDFTIQRGKVWILQTRNARRIS